MDFKKELERAEELVDELKETTELDKATEIYETIQDKTEKLEAHVDDIKDDLEIQTLD